MSTPPLRLLPTTQPDRILEAPQRALHRPALSRGPFLDVGDETPLKPGMVFTVEPGLYVPGIGGFRHSDTVVITEDGIEIMTYYPRDLDSLTLPE
jgi:Xaa-Pro aminopeptidase